jgi:polysaccharide biosynthesis protein PslA
MVSSVKHLDVPSQPPKAVPLWIVEAGFKAIDAIGIFAAGFIAMLLMGSSIGPDMYSFYLRTLLIGTLVALLFFEWRFVYQPETRLDYWLAMRRIFSAWLTTIMAFLAIGFLLKIGQNYSRLWFMLWAALSLFLILGGRALFQIPLHSLQRRGYFDRRVAIVGAGMQGERLSLHLKQNADANLRVVGIYDDRTENVERLQNGMTIRGTTNDLLNHIRRNQIDQVVIALPWSAEDRINFLIRRFALTPVSIRLAPDLAGFSYQERHYSLVAGLPVLNLFDRPISGFDQFVKAIEDRTLALLGLIALAPIMLLCAIAIKLDSRGPIFFRQKRVGFNDAMVKIWKFRSMFTDLCEQDNVRQASRNDPRITRVGAFLRRTSLDELPQLFNVLMGEMSIVGPRPHAPSTRAGEREFHMIVDHYGSRHRVKPGLTGWAQVNGWRGETDTEIKLIKRLEHDLHYIENWSLMFDIQIIFRTVGILINQKNAF